MNEILKLAGEVVLKPEQRIENLNTVPLHMDVEVRLLGVGDVHSKLTGGATITKEDVLGLAKSYNYEMQQAYDQHIKSDTKAKRLAGWVKGNKINDFLGKSVITDHNEETVHTTIGRIKGLLNVEGHEENPELWGTLRILGPDNVLKVADTRLTRLSAGFKRAPLTKRQDPSVREEDKWPQLGEVSFVPIGAYRPARVEDSKLMHPVLLSGSQTSTQIPETSYLHKQMIKIVYDQLELVDKELDNVQEILFLQGELNSLASEGKILPRHLKGDRMLKKMLSIQNKSDRKAALSLLNMMPSQICLSGTTNSSNAVKGMEMIMAADNTLAEKAKQFSEEVKKNFDQMNSAERANACASLRKQSIKLSGAPAETHATKENYTSGAMEYKFAGDCDAAEEEYLTGMEKLMGEGKHEEMKKMTHAYRDHKKKSKETSEKQKKDAAEKNEKLSGYKEELKVLLSGLISENNAKFEALEVKLSGFTEQLKGAEDLTKKHGELIEFVNKFVSTLKVKE